MSRFAEVVGTNVDAWRSHTQGLITPRHDVFADRLDTLQTELAESGWFVVTGHEVEFLLVPGKQGVQVPERDPFYDELVLDICGDQTPRAVSKGRIVDPMASSAPLLLNYKLGGTYHYENGYGRVMELRTYPSPDWRTSTDRYWNTIGSAGSLAAKYGCLAKIVSTHMSTSLAFEMEGGLVAVNNFAPGNELMVAMQAARRVLRPLEPYPSLVLGRGETFPNKAGLWNVEAYRTETRFPVFGIHDTRSEMLGAFVGVERHLAGRPHLAEGALHRCDVIDILSKEVPEVNVLSHVLVWDRTSNRMVIPEDMHRSNIGAAGGSRVTRALDCLVSLLSDGAESDFSANNGALLRKAVGDLTLDRDSIQVTTGSSFSEQWRWLLEGARAEKSMAVRIAMDSPVKHSEGYVPDRVAARQSPRVAEVLGPDLMKVLTAPSKAYAMRQRVLNTRS